MGDVRDRMDEYGTPLCRWCGQYSTAQVCYRCTTDPLAGKVIDLERQLAEAKADGERIDKMADLCDMDLHELIDEWDDDESGETLREGIDRYLEAARPGDGEESDQEEHDPDCSVCNSYGYAEGEESDE